MNPIIIIISFISLLIPAYAGHQQKAGLREDTCPSLKFKCGMQVTV